MRKFLFSFSLFLILGNVGQIIAQTCNTPFILPIVLTELNGTQHQNVNDGITDVITIGLCGNYQDNIFISSPFAEIAGGVQTRLFQIIQTNNASMGPWCNNCQTLVSNFVPFNYATARIINPQQPGSVTVSWIPWVDSDNQGDIDIGECVGDTIRWIFNLQDTERPDLDCRRDLTIALESDITCDTFLYLIPDFFDFACSHAVTGLRDELNPALWSTSSLGQGTPVFNIFAPDSIRIRGASGGVGNIFTSNSDARLCHTFACSGTFSFSYRVRKTPGAPAQFGIADRAYYTINGNVTPLTPNILANTASGNVTVQINAGDVFCFWVQSNNAGSHTILVADNFNFMDYTVTQTMGPMSNSAPGINDGEPFTPGVHVVQFIGRDCGGNTDTCSINITVTDTPPTITCPENITILLDTFDCNRVYCYNVVAEDNCPNTNLDIPGFQFIGIHDGNSYFISAEGVINHLHWEEANRIAAELGGHLVTIEDVDENNFLVTNIPFANPLAPGNGIGENQYWMGLRYSPMLAQFKWTTGEPFMYENWDTNFGQPGVIPGPYGWFLDLFNLGTWWDSPSLLFRRYIIEFENGLRTRLISGIPSGGQFPPGVTTNVYEVEDAFGQTATCSFSVNVIGSTHLSCKPINVSLDENCSAFITPEMLLTGPYNCYDVFEVTLSHYDVPVPNPITRDWLGKKLKATVTDPTTGNRCWSEILVEDKLAPEIVCENDTVSCIGFINREDPAAGDDCSQFTVHLIDEFTSPLRCDPLFVKSVTRRYVSIDAIGNVSDTCTQVLYVERAPLNEIVYPLDIEILCDDVRYDAFGGVDPVLTGIPQLEGMPIYPWNDFLCNVHVEYEDIDLGEINCVRKIMRTWRAREWWCNDELVFFNIPPQLITIVDRTGPEITFRPHDFHATTGNRSCVARVPLPSLRAEDACHGIFRIDIAYPGGSLVGQNGGIVDLPVGENEIIYRVYDSCYNVSTDTLIITVTDDTEPVAVCDRRTVTALNHWGEVWMPAEVLDDGSFDECKVDRFEVRRMDLNHCGTIGEDDWGPEVQFCCEDVGHEIMVGFKVIDHSGNEAVCMVLVEVQDKEGPQIICPPNITVECRYDIDLTNLDEFGVIRFYEAEREDIVIDPSYYHVFDTPHPRDGLATDNCPPLIIEMIDTSGMDQCGNGEIVRTFTATDQQGSSASCTHSIVITSTGVFTEDDIRWPEDFDTTGICDSRLLIPEVLIDTFIKQPRFTDDECSLIGITYKDRVFPSTIPGEPCFKIFRTWKLIDWCYRNDNNEPQIYIREQLIKVYNESAPVIDRNLSNCRDTVICTYDEKCLPIPVRFTAAATDDCTPVAELLWRYKVDFNSDGSFDVNSAAINGNVAAGTWPIGKHIFKWEVEDRCGNVDFCQFNFELRNCKSPVAYCLFGLATSLTPMDTSMPADGIPDIEMTTVWAKDFDQGSYHTCGYPVALSFSRDTNDKFRAYDCDSIGRRDVELWVTDINGNTSFCRTYILVQDSNNVNICPPSLRKVTVNGLVQTHRNEKVENVEIALDQNGLGTVVTDFDGVYNFGQMDPGGHYMLKPNKNDDWLNGITTADIVRIQRHILNVSVFQTPYEMIAADVNNSKNITARDMADLRKLILGVEREIAGNTSWRFVDEAYSFRSVDQCLDELFPEYYEIQNLRSNMAVNFTGIKVGDLNGSAKTRGVAGGLKVRESRAMKLISDEQSLQAGQVYAIDIKGGENAEGFAGLQFTMQFDPSSMELLEIIGDPNANFGNTNFSRKFESEGLLTVSWDGELNQDDKLFTLIIKAKQNGSVSNILRLSNAITPVLAVDKYSNEEARVVWQIGDRVDDGFHFEVFQNNPNPWAHQTLVQMSLPESGEVMLSIYDAKGKMHYQAQRDCKKGLQEWQIDRNIIPIPGLYFYQIDYNNQSVTKRMVVTD